MTRTALLIGIGVGDPNGLTLNAIDAMRSVDAFLVLDKPGAEELTGFRRQILDRHVGAAAPVVLIADPPRDRSAERGDDRPDSAYAANVDSWHAARASALATAIADHVPDGGAAGFLVWGDPGLYDSTLRVIERVGAQLPLDVRVIPGISSVHALTAAHAILLNRVGEPIHITTGRRLSADGFGGPAGNNAVVMLDADCTFRAVAEPTDHVYWGAYLGTEHQILIDGPVGEVGDEIARVRGAARDEHGWIMDVYLLRRP